MMKLTLLAALVDPPGSTLGSSEASLSAISVERKLD
jgi:hypothetical protein